MHQKNGAKPRMEKTKIIFGYKVFFFTELNDEQIELTEKLNPIFAIF